MFRREYFEELRIEVLARRETIVPFKQDSTQEFCNRLRFRILD